MNINLEGSTLTGGRRGGLSAYTVTKTPFLRLLSETFPLKFMFPFSSQLPPSLLDECHLCGHLLQFLLAAIGWCVTGRLLATHFVLLSAEADILGHLQPAAVGW